MARFRTITLLDQQDGLCGICGKPAEPWECNIDHIIPRARGGKTIEDNLQATHVKCNTEKGAHELKPVVGKVRKEREVLRFSTQDILRRVMKSCQTP